MEILNWHSYDGGLVQEASQDEHVYTVRDLGQNGSQLDVRLTGDNPRYPRLILRVNAVADVRRLAESIASGVIHVDLDSYPSRNELIGDIACVFQVAGLRAIVAET